MRHRQPIAYVINQSIDPGQPCAAELEALCFALDEAQQRLNQVKLTDPKVRPIRANVTAAIVRAQRSIDSWRRKIDDGRTL